MPCAVEYELTNTDTASNLPELADNFAQNEASLLKALDDAMNTVSTDAIRFATNKIQLRGQKGEIVATDGRQLLWQSGYQFPWTEDLLVPRIKAFACSELSNSESVAIGKTAKHVCIRVGNWTFYLPIDKEGRFPKAENVIPSKVSATTHLQLDDKDVTFLTKTLPRLPGDEGIQSPVTLDLNGQVVVRARAEEQERSTEAILSRSRTSGHSLRFPTNRNHLSRALNLGFTEIHFASADRPVLCEDQRRKFVFLGLGKDAALAWPFGQQQRFTARKRQRTLYVERQWPRDDKRQGLSRPHCDHRPASGVARGPRLSVLVAGRPAAFLAPSHLGRLAKQGSATGVDRQPIL